MENNWFLGVNGETYGPYTWAQMYEMTKTNQVTSTSLIYHEQLGSWVEAYLVKELGLAAPAMVNQQQYQQQYQQPQYMAGGMNQPPKKKHGCLIGCLSVFAITFIGIALVVGLVIWPMFNKPMLDLGKPIEVASEKIDEEGGIIEVKDADSEIDGLILEIPKDAYDGKNTFEISTREIRDQEFGDNFKPILPLIHIENGGDLSAEMMTMTIPVDLASDEIPLACYYLEDGTLEAIEMIGLTEDEITIGVSHFSDIIITALEKSLLEEYVGLPEHNSGFLPGVDNWSFTNYGSEVASGGMCAGMTLSEIHYYIYNRKNGGVPLHAYLDNNHYNTTPDWWKDDSLGIRLASVVQKELDWDNKYKRWTIDYTHKVQLLSDETKFFQFAYAFLLTDESPQAVSIWVRSVNNGVVNIEAGHAILAYAIDSTGIYVCDPNYPDRTDLKIPFDGTHFGIYDTTTKAGEKVYKYNSFCMMGTTSLFSKESMDGLFKEADKDPYESTVGDHLFSDPEAKYMVLEEGEPIWVNNVSVIELLPEDGSKYKKKVEEYLKDSNLEAIWNTKPADWETKNYLLSLLDANSVKGAIEVYINQSEKAVIDTILPVNGGYCYIPIDEGMTNVGVYFCNESTHSDGTDTWKSYDAIDYYRTSVFFGEVDLTGTWKGDFQIVDYEKALNFIEEIVVKLLHGFVRVLATAFEQDLSDEEIDQIVRDSIEVNESITDPIPIELVLSNKKDDTYDASVTYETEAIYTYKTEAVFDGEILELTVISEDGAQMKYTYYVYDNTSISGEFEMIYAGLKEFMTGTTDLVKQ